MNTRTLLGCAVAAALVTATAVPLTAMADDCRVRYQYNTPSGDRPQENLTLSVHQTQNVGRSRLDFVENTGINDVMIFLENVPNTVIQLGSGQRDPAGNHLTAAARLVSVQCLASVTPPPLSPQAWAQALRNAGATAETVATGLNQLFGRTLTQTLQIMEAIGYPVAQAAAAAKAVFDPAATAMANALRTIYGRTRNQVAQILRDLGYTAEQMAQAIKDAFDATATQVAQRLNALYGWTADQTVILLRNMNYTAQQAAEAMRDAYQRTEAQVVRLLRDAGYTVSQVIAAARSLYNATAEQVATWMRAAGYTLQQLSATLIQQFNLTAQQAFDALVQAGYDTAQVLAEIRSRFSLTLQATIDLWMVYHCPNWGSGSCVADETMRNLFEILQAGPQQFAEAFANLARNQWQQSAQWAAQRLRAINQITRAMAEAALLAAGWAAAEVQAALDAAYGAGSALVQTGIVAAQTGMAAGAELLQQGGMMLEQGTEALVAGAQSTAQAVGSYTELVEGYTTYAPNQAVPVSQRIGATIVAKGALANTTTGVTMATRGWQVSKVEPAGAIIGPATHACNELNTLCVNAIPGPRVQPGLSSITVSYPGGFSQTIPVRIVQHARIQGVTNQPFARGDTLLTRSSCDLNATETFDLQIQGENLALGRELALDCPSCSAGTRVTAVSSSANAATVRITVNNINRVGGTLRFVSPHSNRHPETLNFRVEARTDCADLRQRR